MDDGAACTSPIPTGASQRARVLGTIALASFPILLLALVNLWRDTLDAEARMAEDRVTLARAAALNTESFVADGLSTVRSLVRTRDLSDPIGLGELADFLEQVRAVNPNIETIGLYDRDGWNVATTGVPPRTVNIGDRPYFRQALATGRTAVSPVLVGRATGNVSVGLADAVERADGGRDVLVAGLSLRRLREELRSLVEDRSIRLVLLDADGRIFIHPEPEVARALPSIRGRADADAVLAGRTGSYRVAEPDGTEMLVAYAPVADRGWGVLVQQPTSTAFAPIRRRLFEAVGLYGLGALVVGLIGWNLGGRLSLSYQRQLEARAQAESTARKLRAVSAESEGRRRFLERLIESAPVAIAVTEGPDHSHVAVNAAFQATRTGANVVGRTVAEVAPEAERPGMIALFDRVFETGEEYTAVDEPYRMNDGPGGEPRYFTYVLARYEDAAGRPEGVISISLETTEQVLTRRRAEREKDEFLSIASHELKTPLSSLGLSAQMMDRMLKRGPVDQGRLERYVANISTQVARATQLIGDLLDVSRIQTGRLQLRREPVDLVEVARSAAQRERDSLEEATHEIVEIADGAPIVIEADEARLDQVLTNLLSNAVKYSPRGGRIEVRLARRDGQVSLEVADHGLGIPEAERADLFAPFSRTPAARQSGVEGTGLGLYITRQIVEAHGGTISIAETPGGGSTFVVTLPVSERRSDESPTREADDAA